MSSGRRRLLLILAGGIIGLGAVWFLWPGRPREEAASPPVDEVAAPALVTAPPARRGGPRPPPRPRAPRPPARGAPVAAGEPLKGGGRPQRRPPDRPAARRRSASGRPDAPAPDHAAAHPPLRGEPAGRRAQRCD